MCGRYFIEIGPDDDELEEIMQDLNRRGLLRQPGENATPPASDVEAPQATKSFGTGTGTAGGEIFPTDVVPVVANSRAGRPRPFAMQWGYTLPGGRRVINARSETAAQRPMFADGMRARRLLIPASGYYEWLHHDKKSSKYAIRRESDRTLYMAGVYRFEAGKPVFAILTRTPAESVAFIHDRMPVILPREAAGDWLNPACDAQAVLRAAALDVTAEAV